MSQINDKPFDYDDVCVVKSQREQSKTEETCKIIEKNNVDTVRFVRVC